MTTTRPRPRPEHRGRGRVVVGLSMYAAMNPTGVTVAEVLAAVEARRQPAEPRAVEWPAAEWARIWTRLTPLQQRVVFLHVFESLTFTRVAELLGVCRGTVCGAWQRALERIRDALPAPT